MDFGRDIFTEGKLLADKTKSPGMSTKIMMAFLLETDTITIMKRGYGVNNLTMTISWNHNHKLNLPNYSHFRPAFNQIRTD